MNRGQTFLALVFLIGGLIMLIGLTLVFFANSFIDTGYGYRASLQAEAVATSGAEDALLQLDRNVNFASTGYTVPVGSSTASVTVTNTGGTATIVSAATVSNHTRKVSVSAAVTTSTGQVSVVAWQIIQ